MLRMQVFQLADANTVLAAASTAEFHRPLDQPFAEARDGLELMAIIGVEHDDEVKVAVAGVADQRCDDVCRRDVGLRLERSEERRVGKECRSRWWTCQ